MLFIRSFLTIFQPMLSHPMTILAWIRIFQFYHFFYIYQLVFFCKEKLPFCFFSFFVSLWMSLWTNGLLLFSCIRNHYSIMLFDAQIVPSLVIKLVLGPFDMTPLVFDYFTAFWPNRMSQVHFLLSLSLLQGVLVPFIGQCYLETTNSVLGLFIQHFYQWRE